jgi:hypothetical protein
MLFFQSLLWKLSFEALLQTTQSHFRLRLESGRTDSGRSYQSKSQQRRGARGFVPRPFFVCPCLLAAIIRPVAIYSYSEPQIEKLVSDFKRSRLRFCGAAAFLVASGFFLALFYPQFPAFPKSLREWLSPLLLAIFAAPLLGNVWNWRSWPEKLRASLKKTSFELSPFTIRVSDSFRRTKQLGKSEILRAEELSWKQGLYLRTANRYRWFLVAASLDGYQALKRELSELGIVVVRTSFPPNWEEFLGVLLFIGTAVCAFSAHSVRVLTLNLFAALLISLGGFFIINSNPDTLPRMRWARFAAFLPFVFAAWGLWFAVCG